MGIYDVMKLCKVDVFIICMGLVVFMGVFFFVVGSKGKRFCMLNLRVMIY